MVGMDPSGYTIAMPAPNRYTGLAGFDLGTDDTPAPNPPARPTKSNDNTVTLRGIEVSLTSDVGGAFISDCAKNRERIFSDDRLREKYEINSDADWAKITQNKSLRLAISAECERRMLNGDASRQAAAKIFTEEGPPTLGSVLRDQGASPRHRVDAARELRATARFDDEKPGADAERVIITINLGNAPEDKLVFDCGVPKHAKEALDAERD